MYAKTSDFKLEMQDLANAAKIFSHPARLAIIQLLNDKKECIVGDIAQEFPFLSRTTVSQHLQELKNIGIIKGEIEGVKICYCLNYEVLNKIKNDFELFFKEIEFKNNCC
jgi:DNA-binding transcriptional ArsR family regulator